MPDAQTLNSVLGAYGISGPTGGGGGINWWNILIGTIFSIVGWYAFIHGKREKSWKPMVIGITLMVYPYFVASTLWSFVIGAGLTAALYFWRD